MSAARKHTESKQRILKVGGTYLDRSRGVLVTLEDHEIRGGRRTGRVVVAAADGVLRFPRRWYCREPDLVPPPRSAAIGTAGAQS
jgi:hypothetical protein